MKPSTFLPSPISFLPQRPFSSLPLFGSPSQKPLHPLQPSPKAHSLSQQPSISSPSISIPSQQPLPPCNLPQSTLPFSCNLLSLSHITFPSQQPLPPCCLPSNQTPFPMQPFPSLPQQPLILQIHSCQSPPLDPHAARQPPSVSLPPSASLLQPPSVSVPSSASLRQSPFVS